MNRLRAANARTRDMVAEALLREIAAGPAEARWLAKRIGRPLFTVRTVLRWLRETGRVDYVDGAWVAKP